MPTDIPDSVVEFLVGAPVSAHLATSVDDRPHVAPVWYAYRRGETLAAAGGTDTDAADGDADIDAGGSADTDAGGSADRPASPPDGTPRDRVELLTVGRKLDNVRRNPRVALSVERADGPEVEWHATLFGTATVVEDPDRVAAARDRIYPKYGADPEAHDSATEGALVVVRVGSGTGRRY